MLKKCCSLSAHALQCDCVTKLGDKEEDASQAVLGGAMGHPSDAPKVRLHSHIHVVALEQSQMLQ